MIIYPKKQGLTLIEIMVVIGIVGIIISFGMVVDWSIINRDNFMVEQDKIVSILQKARSRAMANMCLGAGCTDGKKHGVCYDSTSNSYVIFQNTCDPLASTSELIPANINISENSATDFPTFVFDQLTGNTTSDTIHIEDGIKITEITINNEGTINW